jgi:hypothetical protein
MRVRCELLLVSFMLAGSGVTFAQAPPTRVTPLQQTAPPAPEHSTNCAPAAPRGSSATNLRNPMACCARPPASIPRSARRHQRVATRPSSRRPEVPAATPMCGRNSRFRQELPRAERVALNCPSAQYSCSGRIAPPLSWYNRETLIRNTGFLLRRCRRVGHRHLRGGGMVCRYYSLHPVARPRLSLSRNARN